MAGHIDNHNFRESLIPYNLLDDAIDWVQKNLSPEDVFTEEQLKSWAKDWAINNEYEFKPENHD